MDLISSDESLYGTNFTNDYANYQTGIVGLSHLYYFSKKLYYKISLAASRQEEHLYRDSLSAVDRTPIPAGQADYVNNKYSTHLLVNKKFSARNNVSAGVILDMYDFDLSNLRLVPGDEQVVRDADGQSLLSQGYAQWQHRFTNRLTLNTGLTYQRLCREQ